MVFMEYKAHADGTIERLPVRVIDVGIGLERIPWLLSGAATSYPGAFPAALREFGKLTGFDLGKLDGEELREFSKYASCLDMDEAADAEKAWAGAMEHSGV